MEVRSGSAEPVSGALSSLSTHPAEPVSQAVSHSGCPSCRKRSDLGVFRCCISDDPLYLSVFYPVVWLWGRMWVCANRCAHGTPSRAGIHDRSSLRAFRSTDKHVPGPRVCCLREGPAALLLRAWSGDLGSARPGLEMQNSGPSPDMLSQSLRFEQDFHVALRAVEVREQGPAAKATTRPSLCTALIYSQRRGDPLSMNGTLHSPLSVRWTPLSHPESHERQMSLQWGMRDV